MIVDFLRYIFDVDTVLFTVLGYRMSVVEFAGTILYLWSVWLISERNILTWPVGIVSVVLYFVMFYQINLYSDMFEQVYYVGASLYGWYYWTSEERPVDDGVDVRLSSPSTIVIWIVVTALVSAVVGIVMSRIHLYVPALFQQPASFPYVDAVTTIMSFAAMFLMAQKRLESWVYWIVVDVVAIWLYFVKDIQFVSLLYVVLLGLATKGLYEWVATYRGRTARASG